MQEDIKPYLPAFIFTPKNKRQAIEKKESSFLLITSTQPFIWICGCN